MKNLLFMSLLLPACGDKEAEDTAASEEVEEVAEEETSEEATEGESE